MRLVDHSSNYLTLLETGFDTLASLVEACDHYTLSYGALDEAASHIESLMPACQRTRPGCLRIAFFCPRCAIRRS
jgi:hypothetical protein